MTKRIIGIVLWLILMTVLAIYADTPRRCRFRTVEYVHGFVMSKTIHKPIQTECGWTYQYVEICPTKEACSPQKIKLLFGFVHVFRQLGPKYGCEWMITEEDSPSVGDEVDFRERIYMEGFKAGTVWFVYNPNCAR